MAWTHGYHLELYGKYPCAQSSKGIDDIDVIESNEFSCSVMRLFITLENEVFDNL